MIYLDLFTVIFTSVGTLFFFAGTVGLLRFPDVFCRLHALTKADNLGLGMIVLGILPQLDSIWDGAQVLLIWVLVMIAGATSCYLVANMASKTAAGQPEEEADHG